jgi:hypothetical protein
MGTRKRAVTTAVAALALAGGIAAAPASASPPAQPSAAVRAPNFWFLHSGYDTREQCEEAAQRYLWPHNPAGADDYECRQGNGSWDLWLMFLS